MIPQGAEVAGTYGGDWFTGTPAVARNRFGGARGWYVATDLDRRGVSSVIRQVVPHHDLSVRCADAAEVEAAVRIALDRTRLLSPLNHGAERVEVPAPGGGTDVLSGAAVAYGDPVRLDGYGVKVLRSTGRQATPSNQ